MKPNGETWGNRVVSRLKRRLADRVGVMVGTSAAPATHVVEPLDMETREPNFIDLVDEWELTFALLDDTRAWRERAVHEIVLRDSDHVDASTAYQIRIPLDLVCQYEPETERGDLVRLLLPFTVRPNELLINADFRGVQGKPAVLLLRREIAEVQAMYLAHVDGRPLGDQPLGGSLWVGVSAYTNSAWREHRDNAKPQAWRRLWPGYQRVRRARALADYLNTYLELGIQPHRVTDWLHRTDKARATLIEALGEGEDPESSSECILLAIPFTPFRPDRIADIDILVDEFSAAVMDMDSKARQVLAEYGRRWEAIIDTVVPAGKSCSIKLFEQRPWIGAPSSILEQEIAFGDSATTHVEIRAADHEVEIDRPVITDLVGKDVDFAVADAVRKTADAVTIYASHPDRPYLARIRVRARLRRSHRHLAMGLLAVIVIAGVVAVVLPETTDLVNSLVLLTLPLTLAGTVVLARETTPLAERLLSRWRTSLAFGIIGLWLVALARLLLIADVAWAESAWSATKDLIRELTSLTF